MLQFFLCILKSLQATIELDPSIWWESTKKKVLTKLCIIRVRILNSLCLIIPSNYI
jgi:hypothetical protein